MFLKRIQAGVKEQDKDFEPGPYSKIKFEDGAEEMRLIIPEGTISDWKMTQLNQLLVYTYCMIKNNIKWCIHVLQVSKEDVDKYPSAAGHKLIPCQVNVEWVGGEKNFKTSCSQFCYEVKFYGARERSYYLAVTLPRRCLCEL